MLNKKNVIVLAGRQMSFEGCPRACHPGVIPRISIRYRSDNSRFGEEVSNGDSAAKEIEIYSVVKASSQVRFAGEHQKNTNFGRILDAASVQGDLSQDG